MQAGGRVDMHAGRRAGRFGQVRERVGVWECVQEGVCACMFCIERGRNLKNELCYGGEVTETECQVHSHACLRTHAHTWVRAYAHACAGIYACMHMTDGVPRSPTQRPQVPRIHWLPVYHNPNCAWRVCLHTGLVCMPAMPHTASRLGVWQVHSCLGLVYGKPIHAWAWCMASPFMSGLDL